MTRPTTRAIVAVLLVAVGALAACSGDDDPPVRTVDDAPSTSAATGGEDASTTDDTTPGTTVAPSSETSPATSVPTPTTTPNAVISIANQPGEGEFEGALEDVGDIGCAAAEGVWTSSGTVTNPTEGAASYRIFVSFLDAAGETLALIETNLDALDPAESREFAVDFPSDAADVTCVLRVERRAA